MVAGTLVEIGNIPDSTITAQVDTLNDRFYGTGISFSLLGISRLEDQEWHDDMVPAYEEEISPALNVAPSSVMNIYIGKVDGSIAGQVPQLPDDGEFVGSEHDGVFVSVSTFPGPGAPLGGLGPEVAVHEAGHYFGLPHTFGPDSTCIGDDGFTDTPLQADANFGCPTGTDSCLLNSPDPIHNFMDYTSDACKFEFTSQQSSKQAQIRGGIRGQLGIGVPEVIDARSAPVVYTHPVFSGQHIYVLPGADVTVTGTVTLLNGARFVLAGGADLSGITNVDLQGASLFDIRSYDAPFTFNGAVTVSGGSKLRLGQRIEEAGTGGRLAPPALTITGDLTVTGVGSTLDVGDESVLSFGTSSLARFEAGGKYVTQGNTEIGANALLVFESDAAAPEIDIEYIYTTPPTFAMGQDARLVFRNSGYHLNSNSTFGMTFSRLDPNEAWDQIAIDGDDITIRNAIIEGGTTGIAVYSPGAVTLDDVTLRDHNVGLDVRSASGVTVTGSTVEQNGDGVQSDFIAQYCPGTTCFTGGRSAFTITNSTVSDNTNSGVRALNTNAIITFTEMSDNGAGGSNQHVGLGVSNATVLPFTDNVIEDNGSFGVAVITGGDIEMRPEPTGFGVNRVAHNALAEVLVYNGGMAFLGSSTQNGRNSVYDTGGGLLLQNTTTTTVEAVNTYWDDFPNPPTGSVVGPVTFTPVSDCDYTVNPPSCLGLRGAPTDLAAGLRPGGSGGGMTPGLDEHSGLDGPEAISDAIQALRVALAENPASAEAPGWVYELGALHRRDREDVLGEWAQTAALLGVLRAPLAVPGLSEAERATAEAALEVEAVAALGREDYREADDLVAGWGPLAEAEAVGRVLGLVTAHLEAWAGRYAEASALVESVAQSEADGDVQAELRAVAAVYARRAEESGAGARGADTASLSRGVEAAVRVPSAEPSLSAFPNPSTGQAMVAVNVPQRADLRLVIYDVLGRRVAQLHDGLVEAGMHRLALDTTTLPAGVYLVWAEITSGAALQTFTERLTVIR